jgi:hypothetical protein
MRIRSEHIWLAVQNTLSSLAAILYIPFFSLTIRLKNGM